MPIYMRSSMRRRARSRKSASTLLMLRRMGGARAIPIHLRQVIVMGFASAQPILRTAQQRSKVRMSAKIDPITRSVVQHRLSSIVKEMGEAMLRTSYSQILNSSRDFSLAICDTRRTPDRAGRSSAGSCRRAAMGDARGRGALQGRQAGRRHPAQRSLSWRQPSARSDRLRAGIRWRQASALDHRARASERYRRRHPWRL